MLYASLSLLVSVESAVVLFQKAHEKASQLLTGALTFSGRNSTIFSGHAFCAVCGVGLCGGVVSEHLTSLPFHGQSSPSEGFLCFRDSAHRKYHITHQLLCVADVSPLFYFTYP